MQLVVDIGNTRTKYGLFKDGELMDTGHSAKAPVYVIKDIFDSEHGIDAIVISSVNDDIDPDLIPIPETIHHVILDKDTPMPFINKYETPETLGHDRMALAAAAIAKFPKKNSLVVDMGTCLTMEFVTSSGEYLGGTISPGIDMRLGALNSNTARLPLVGVGDTIPDLIGKTTSDCIRSGVVNGILFEINGTINRLESEFGELKILLTGGNYSMFENELKSGIFADPNLVLFGLHEILRYNIDEE